jgi:RNA polymerase sigma-70 factor (ECF subfamily)
MQSQLVERARSGDHEAFAALASASFDRLYALATLILRDGDRAQDAVQEALVSAWRDVRALRDVTAWDAWLHRLTVRACYRAAGRERRRAVVELHTDTPVERTSPHDFASSLADRDYLQRAIEQLPIDQRAVLVVHFYLDLPLTEAADVLGIPVGTAKSRLHYGLKALRSSLVDRAAVQRPAPRIRESTT